MTWKLIFEIVRLLFDILLVWMLFGRAGKRGSAKDLSARRIEFSPDRLSLWAWPSTIAYLAWWIARDLIQHHGKPSDFLNPAILGFTALALLFSFPGTVVVSDAGLEQVYWFRKNKRIPWKHIDEIETSATSNAWASSVAITSAKGTKILHSYLLADRARFLLEIEQHCGEDLPPEFPRESSASCKEST